MHRSVAFLNLLTDILLLHVLQLSVDLLLMVQVADKQLLLLGLFCCVSRIHLLLKLASILCLDSLTPFELLLCDVLEVVGRSHMHLLVPGRWRSAACVIHVGNGVPACIHVLLESILV